MRLHEHTHETDLRTRRQTFCGPGALSVILGISAEAGARLINEKKGKLRNTEVRGTAKWMMIEILREQGIVVEELEVDWKFGTRRASDREWFAAERMDGVTTLQNDTLAKWFRERDYKTRTSVCLIVCGHHYVVVKGTMIADNQQGKIRFEKSRHKRKRVTAAYRLSEAE